MKKSELAEKLRESFTGTLVVASLKEPYRYYTCPCGGTDHLASRCLESADPPCVSSPTVQVLKMKPLLPDGYAPVLHCRETGQQWHLVDSVAVTAEIIRNEEQRYLDLLKRAPSIIHRYSTKHKVGPRDFDKVISHGKGDAEKRMTHWEYLHSTYGLDRETVEDVMEWGARGL